MADKRRILCRTVQTVKKNVCEENYNFQTYISIEKKKNSLMRGIKE